MEDFYKNPRQNSCWNFKRNPWQILWNSWKKLLNPDEFLEDSSDEFLNKTLVELLMDFLEEIPPTLPKNHGRNK